MLTLLSLSLSATLSHAYLTTTCDDLAKNPHYSFSDYLAEFSSKEYPDTNEYALRKQTFDRALTKIRSFNQADHSWKMGLNSFTDWTPVELDSLKGLDPSLLRASSTVHHHHHQYEASTSFPKSLDWRNATPSVITPIKEQGLCGSCWAFATTEAIESAAAIATGKLQVLAPQQLVSCAPNPNDCGGTGGCSGSIPSLGFNYTVSAGGLSLEATYPFHHQDTPCNGSEIQPVVGIQGYVNLPPNNATALMAALQIGPVAISASANWAAYERGVFDGPHGEPCGYAVDHAIVLVGYGKDEASGKNYWTLRNSWTPQWGEHGYMRILRAPDGEAEPCGIDANPSSGVVCKNESNVPQRYCGTCGLLSLSAYPVGAFNVGEDEERPL